MVESESRTAEGAAGARYVYCVLSGEARDWQLRGLDGKPVRAVCAAGLTALVHDCPPEPYQGDDERVKSWVLAHSDVVDAAWERSGTVLPLGFDTIVRPGDGLDADERVMRWLTSEGHRFRGVLERLRGKVELGVQVIWDQRVVGESVAQGNDEIRQLRAEMTSKPKGLAYFYQQRIERALRQAIETKAEEDYRSCFRQVTALFPEVRTNDLKKLPGHLMIVNLSVLAPRDRVSELGAVLTGFQGEGVDVRFTGPWPPYSFVGTAASEAAVQQEAGQEGARGDPRLAP
ncbi:MAG: GvpL/GvpF family gas vesicle protein [Acidobacteria bacterium]|nr:GvpL/GvpF family gas vesicle protein [Acidobacteriota bacterium]